MEELDPITNTITLPDGSVVVVDLSTMTPRSVLGSKGATCRLNNQEIPCPPPAVFTKHESNGRIIQVHTDGSGNILQISIIDEVEIEEGVVEADEKPKGKKKKKEKVSLEVIGQNDIYADDDSGKEETIGNVVFTYVPDDAVDVDYLDAHFHMQHMGEIDGEERNRNRSLLRKGSNYNNNMDVNNMIETINKQNNIDMRRDLQVVNGDCDEYREVEVAIAADSAFCNTYSNWQAAEAKIYSIMSDVSDYYEVKGLCLVMTAVFIDLVCICRACG